MSATLRPLAFALAALVLLSRGDVRAQGVPAAPRPAPEAADHDDSAHTLEIREGGLWLDGRALPPEAVPDELDLTGLAMAVQFSGPVTPVVEVDGVAYVLEGERLVRFEESSRAGGQIYFLGAPVSVPAAEEETAMEGFAPARAEGPTPDDDARLRRAGEAAYLAELSASDRALYDKIRREAELEEASLRLAAQIRATTDPAERARLTAQLRASLEGAFDLKQEIRAAEIERAEAQVAELRRMLRVRADRKGQIIERRLRELVAE
jgi:hypothetical protein